MFSSYYEWEARMRQRETQVGAAPRREPMFNGLAMKSRVARRIVRVVMAPRLARVVKTTSTSGK